MSLLVALLLFVLLLFFSAVFSGSETGVYSISHVRLDAEAREGRRSARLLRRLTRNDTALLITLLVGNNLMLELATHLAQTNLLERVAVPTWAREILVALFVTPIVFLFSELMPKDAFRRRPHMLLSACAPLLSLASLLFLPLTWPIARLSRAIERLAGLRPTALGRVLRREELFDLLKESLRVGALEPHAEELARNVLVLRETPLASVMVPWKSVKTVDLDAASEEARETTAAADFSRLPAVRRVPGGEEGAGASRRVAGYLVQLDVLGASPETGVEEHLRPIQELDSGLSLDRALSRLRTSGQRIALVGPPEAPQGIVTLMDLVSAISGHGAPKTPIAATTGQS